MILLIINGIHGFAINGTTWPDLENSTRLASDTV